MSHLNPQATLKKRRLEKKIIKGELKEFSKNLNNTNIWLLYKKVFALKSFFMFLANLTFVVSHLKIHPDVDVNTSKALTSL